MFHQVLSPLPWSKHHLHSTVHLHSHCPLEAGALAGGRALKTTLNLEHLQLHNLSWVQHWGSLVLELGILGMTMAQILKNGIMSVQAPVVLWIPLAACTHSFALHNRSTAVHLPDCQILLTRQGTKSWDDKAAACQGELHHRKTNTRFNP